MGIVSISSAKQRTVRVLAAAGVGLTLVVSAGTAQAAKPASHPSGQRESHSQAQYHVPVAHATGHKVG